MGSRLDLILRPYPTGDPNASMVERHLLPAVHAALPSVFPEFGWVPTRHGWRASNESFTHERFSVRAERIISTDSRGFLIHGGESMHWLAYANGGSFPVGEQWHEVVRAVGAKACLSPPARTAVAGDDVFARCLGEVMMHAQPKLDEAMPFLKSRGLDRTTAAQWGFGFISSQATLIDEIPAGRRIFGEGLLTERPRPDGTSIWDRRVICPWRDSRGRVVALWGRCIDKDVDAGSPKYLVCGRRPLLFGHDRALPQARRAGMVLVEGFFDAIVLQANGYGNVAARGGTSITDEVLDAIDNAAVSDVTVVFDGDAGGRAGLEQLVRTMRTHEGSLSVNVVDPRFVDADPDELVCSGRWPAVLAESRSWLTWWASTLLEGVSPASAESIRLKAAKACAALTTGAARRFPIEVGEVARIVEVATGIRSAYVLTPTDRDSVSPAGPRAEPADNVEPVALAFEVL